MNRPFANPLKQLLREGKKTLGAWAQLGSPLTAEILARAGFDWLMIDMEHGPGDIMTLISQCQAISGTECVPLVRAPWNDFVVAKRILDAGAYGILFPYVNTAAEAEAAVRACKYPPQGIRGVAGSPRAVGFGQDISQYLSRANDELLVLVAVETLEAVANLPEILGVEGLDGVFIGPMDLATSMGYFANPGHPEVQSAIARAEEGVLRAGKVLATTCTSWEQAENLYQRGYQMLMVLADGVGLAKLAADRVTAFRKSFPQR
jgi:2-keto-3-deoxy-L-rhamnonate aldolase RhmA